MTMLVGLFRRIVLRSVFKLLLITAEYSLQIDMIYSVDAESYADTADRGGYNMYTYVLAIL